MDNLGSDKFVCGYQKLKKLKTGVGSHAYLYLGTEGFSLDTSLKNLLTVSLSLNLKGNIAEIADLQVLRDP